MPISGMLICTHSLTADVGVPHLCVKLHEGRLEGVHIRDLNVNSVNPTGVWGVWWPWESALKVCEVAGVDGGGRDSRVIFVCVHIGQLLGNTAFSGGGHVEGERRTDEWKKTIVGHKGCWRGWDEALSR